MTRDTTLDNLREQGESVFVSCIRCNRYETLEVNSLIEEFGKSYPASLVGQQLSCTKCGGLFVKTCTTKLKK